MAAKAGDRLGNFEILAPIGSGGMGEVFRARDHELGRIVAIKVLRAEIARDAELLQRFRREARTLASLNHPHIAQIFGIAEGVPAEAGGEPAQGLVLELVDGDTLEDRIRKGGLGWREALEIASQIADALEAAHAQGIVHRDLKPANVKITASGSVKVLDFGIALSAVDADGRSGIEHATKAGTIIGTPGYMSPEQVRGQSVDRRTDVWAFGCLLYEMLTRQPAFGGTTDVDMLGVILQRDPDWSQLPGEIPAEVSRLLRRCLRKERSERLRDMGDIRVWIQDALAAPPSTGGDGRARWRSVAPWLIAGAATAGLAVLAASLWREPPPRVWRGRVMASGSAAISVGYNDRDIAITPDGSHLIWVGNNGTQIFVLRHDALTPEGVSTGRPFGLFTSPDSQWIGFRGRSVLRKVPVKGGPAITLATLDDIGMSGGAAWAPDGTIILASGDETIGLQRVADSGAGNVEVLTTPDRAQGEADHLWPEMLPDGHSVLFTITALTGGLEAAQVAVLDLETGQRRQFRGGGLPRGASHARYVPSGHLVYARAGTLQAVAFDPHKLEIRGTPVTVIPELITTGTGGVNLVVADDGTMAYLANPPLRTLVWVDREGREESLGAPLRPYFLPALSPDGTKVAVFSNDEQSDLWIWDLNRRTLSQLTTVPLRDVLQVWTPDGESVIFSSERAGGYQLFRQAIDRPGEVAERLLEIPGTHYAMDVTPDGRLIYTEFGPPETGIDLMTIDLDGTPEPQALVKTPAAEVNATVSPDGRWLAYEAGNSGAPQIYVRPYPDLDGPIQVTADGGTRPLWTQRQDGPLELIYVAASTGALMGMEVQDGPAWEATPPSVVVREGYFTNNAWYGRSYDISPDGERFLMIKESGPAGAPSVDFIVVHNWFEELRRLAPAD